MECTTVREQLSQWHDGALPPDLAAVIRDHVADCGECARLAHEIAQLSSMAKSLRSTNAPAPDWARMSAELDREVAPGDAFDRETVESAPATMGGGVHNLPQRIAVAAAAVLVLLAGLGYLRWRGGHTDEHASLVSRFDDYLAYLPQDPARAQDVLTTNYRGRSVTESEAEQSLQYRPNAPDALPGGFVRQGMYLLQMPCCLCVQTVYQDGAGGVLVVFEHDDRQPGWFGPRPAITAPCHGIATNLVQLDDRLAATWKCGPRYLTVVGARDMAEVASLVESLGGTPSAAPRDKRS